MFQMLANIESLGSGGATTRITRENVLNPLHDGYKAPLLADDGL